MSIYKVRDVVQVKDVNNTDKGLNARQLKKMQVQQS